MVPLSLNPKAISNATHALVYDHLRAGNTACFVVSTSSMWPALAPGDKLFIRAAQAGELRRGDIIIRSFAGAWIAHRLIGRAAFGNTHHLLTKGDNASIADDPWHTQELVGAVIAIERDGQKKSASIARARWLGFAAALLSCGELFARKIKWSLLRRVAVRGVRACLRTAGRIAL